MSQMDGFVDEQTEEAADGIITQQVRSDLKSLVGDPIPVSCRFVNVGGAVCGCHFFLQSSCCGGVRFV